MATKNRFGPLLGCAAGTGDTEGEGLTDGLGLGEGEGEATGDGVGLVCPAAVAGFDLISTIVTLGGLEGLGEVFTLEIVAVPPLPEIGLGEGGKEQLWLSTFLALRQRL